MREAPLMEHLEELRSRLIWAIAAWGVFTAVAFTFRVQILEALRRPLDAYNATAEVKAELIVLNITEPFLVAFKVAAFGGLALALPFIVYQVWAFIAPGLFASERRLAVPFILGAGFSCPGVSIRLFCASALCRTLFAGFFGRCSYAANLNWHVHRPDPDLYGPDGDHVRDAGGKLSAGPSGALDQSLPYQQLAYGRGGTPYTGCTHSVSYTHLRAHET